MSHIIVFGTGGTIASRKSSSTAAVATTGISELLAPLMLDVRVEAREIMRVGSYNLGFSEMRRIAEAARTAVLEPDVSGVVVTHGTDTMEETAYLTALICEPHLDSPIVFTGAQYAADSASPDGPRNLLDAISFASHPELSGIGVGMAFAGELLTARGTRKVHTVAPSPFQGGTVLARQRGHECSVYATPIRTAGPIVLSAGFDHQVIDVVISSPGVDTALFELAVQRSNAVVLVGTGAGNAAPGFVAAVASATAAGVPVILATRVALGPVIPTYGDGGGADLVQAGAIPAADLSHTQARVLAAALLADAANAPQSVSEFATRFSEFAG